MSQVYFLEIVYLVLGALLLLSDSHGVKYPLLLSLRHEFRLNRAFRLGLLLSGLALTVLSLFVPYRPGPIVLGDLVVTLNLLLLSIWMIARFVSDGKGEKAKALEEASTYMERNKKVLGFVTILVAVIHFLVPFSVLL